MNHVTPTNSRQLTTVNVKAEAALMRYIRMTCDTNNEQLLQNFQYFATEIEPKTAPYSNELNKKIG